MVQHYIWYKFAEAKPEEYKLVLVQDKRLVNPTNPQGIGLGYCWGYSMQVVTMSKDSHAIVDQDFRPEFWSTLGNEKPEDIFEKPKYNDVEEKIYPEYHTEWHFKGRGRKRTEPEVEAEEIDLEDEIDLDDDNLF